MNCFDGNLASIAFEMHLDSIKASISKLQAQEMDRTDRDAWVDYYCSECEVDTVEIFPNSMEIDINEETLQEYNSWYQLSREAPQYVTRPGYKATCKVPFTGDPGLFNLQPNPHTLLPFEVDRIIKPTADKPGYLILSFELLQCGASGASIKKHFEDEIGLICAEVQKVNNEAIRFNEGIRDSIEKAVDERISQIDKLATIRQELHIPLNRVQDAPMAKPIHLKKKKLIFSKPMPREDGEMSYSISDDDYEAINAVITQCCTIMEQAPDSFSSLTEEQLRDYIRGMLGTHWDNVSGETFRNRGKTDILIPRDNRVAYIAECKIWHGKKLFLKAINQLFSYTTWRDTKVSVIVFNKENKNFDAVQSTIDEALNDHAIKVSRLQDEVWTCTIQDPVDERVMHVTVLVFNLFVRPVIK